MAGKILKSILTVAIAVLITSLLVVTGLLYQDFNYMQKMQLRDELRFAATATEQLGLEYLEKLPSDRYRLTWISADGDVIYDSKADPAHMENHADREEIKEAFEDGEGNSVRYSDTAMEKNIYKAVRLEDGSILRISISSDTSAAVIFDMLYPIAIIAVLAVAISVFLARRMTRQVVEPLNQMDLNAPMEEAVYEELQPLMHRINVQQKEIEYQLQLLERQKQEFHQITNHMKEALVLLDVNQRILSINPAAVDLYQFREKCIGKLFSPEKYEADMKKAIDEAKESGHAEFTASVLENEYLFNISSIEAEGMVYGIVVLAIDVTEKVNAERIRRDFTSNVSHELKTPLQSIIGSAELIENGIVMEKDMPRFVGHIRKEASRLVKLIEDIIRLSQLDEGSQLPVEEVSMLEIAEEVREVLAYAAGERKVNISVSGEKGTLTGVQSLLFELVYNLTDNAVRYNVEGGQVEIVVRELDKQVQVCVKDTGIGIPSEHQGKIFERFYRVDKSHSRKSGGTGLGLSIVKHAVKYHHGTIQMESEVGKGTTIAVTLQS